LPTFANPVPNGQVAPRTVIPVKLAKLPEFDPKQTALVLSRAHFEPLKKMYLTSAAAARISTMMMSTPIRPIPHIIPLPIM
jgi:hypothetical protein